jgi:hypothetical protein
MDAAPRQFCPLCRGQMPAADAAVRDHLIADHRRSSVEADELIARFDTAKPIPQPEPYMYCAAQNPARGRALLPSRPVH